MAAIAFESQQGMAITDANGVLLKVNQGFTRISGYEPRELIGRTPRSSTRAATGRRSTK